MDAVYKNNPTRDINIYPLVVEGNINMVVSIFDLSPSIMIEI
jgi:hypothetical protein